MNTKVIDNYSKIGTKTLLIPFSLLVLVFLFLLTEDALSVKGYVEIQKGCFYAINKQLSAYPDLMYNLTQMGDALVFLSFLGLFIIYAPKIWEALVAGSLLSLIFSSVLKNIFAIPRPAASFDNSTFTIIGKTLNGHNSLPSGHAITIFTVLTVILFSLMPEKQKNKIFWYIAILFTGILLASSRVAVGAHFPLDITVGGITGMLSGILGILFSKKYKLFSWISSPKARPFFMLLFIVASIAIINKINKEHLIIYYLSLISLLISLYRIAYVYFKK